MGVGTNVQARAVALHHLDAPWRPADIEQREGRILRQGNQNPEVDVIRYVTEGSFDTYMWQTLERKAAFIAQVTRGDLPDRDVEDIGDQALSYAEVKALATGDPLVLEKASVDAEVARLSRLERSHQDDQHRLRRTLASATDRSARAAQRADQLQAAIDRLTDTRGDRFAMHIDGQHHTKRTDAGAHLQRLLAERLDTTPPETIGDPAEVAHLGGLTVIGQAVTVVEDEVRVAVADAHVELTYPARDWQRADPATLVTRLERQLQRLPDALLAAQQERDSAASEAARAEVRIGKPWDRADELTALRRRLQEIDEALAATTAEQPEGHPSTDQARDATAGGPSHGPNSGPEPPDAVAAIRSRLDALEQRGRPRVAPLSR